MGKSYQVGIIYLYQVDTIYYKKINKINLTEMVLNKHDFSIIKLN